MPSPPAPTRASRTASSNWQSSVLRSWLGPHPVWPMRQKVLELAGVTPSPEQLRVLESRLPNGAEASLALVTGGIQAGKSYLTALDILSRIPWVMEGEAIWIVGPDYRQAQWEFRYLLRWLQELDWLAEAAQPKGNEPWILTTVFGGRVQTFSSLLTQKLAGEAPVYIAQVEAGQQTEDAFWTCRARANIRPARHLMVGTLENGVTWYARLAKAWSSPTPEGAVSYTLPTWSNTELFPGGYDNAKIQQAKRELPPTRFDMRYAGLPTAPPGLVFAEYDANVHDRRILLAPRPPEPDPWTVYLDPDTPLEVWIDPGYKGAYAVLAVAVVGGVAYVLDEIYVQDQIDQQVIQTCMRRPWWRLVRRGICDIAGKQHHGTQSTIEVWQAPLAAAGAALNIVANKVPLDTGIQRTRVALRVDALRRPGLFVDPRCVKLRWELSEGYRYPVDGAGLATSEIPLDTDNHACKALAYGLFAHFGAVQNDKWQGYGTRPTKALPYHYSRMARSA